MALVPVHDRRPISLFIAVCQLKFFLPTVASNSTCSGLDKWRELAGLNKSPSERTDGGHCRKFLTIRFVAQYLLYYLSLLNWCCCNGSGGPSPQAASEPDTFDVVNGDLVVPRSFWGTVQISGYIVASQGQRDVVVAYKYPRNFDCDSWLKAGVTSLRTLTSSSI